MMLKSSKNVCPCWLLSDSRHLYHLNSNIPLPKRTTTTTVFLPVIKQPCTDDAVNVNGVKYTKLVSYLIGLNIFIILSESILEEMIKIDSPSIQ